ncbi:hypothetical protein BBJ29_005567 [Phytophthora kernoviae]|uniref:Protein kinase domain-containing protein n=1 Tax=Phytophthora kernoviae TaxID=325452 RepID=A0A3F2RH01_9STRA|nr:hypothetical protein BBJ29_005567 [Phytophthora kernoviae]RLN56702.1 hypothetical protein BBP00_00007871 [Phytophthora kernoviae]
MTCIDVEKSREDAGYTEIWLMLAKLHETEVDTRSIFVNMKEKKIGEKQAMLYEEEAVFEYNAGRGGNNDVAEEILERGVDNDALTPAEKESLLERVVTGTAGWVKAFSGAPIEQKILSHPRKKQTLQDIRMQDDRKVLGERKGPKDFKKDISFAQDKQWGLDDRKPLSDRKALDRKALGDIKALGDLKETASSSPAAKSETQPKKKVDVGDITRILTWEPKFRGGNNTEDHESPAENPKAINFLVSRYQVGGLQYIKLEQIGSGGSSKVFRMLGPDLKIYALKKIKLKKLDEQSIAQYTNEINLLRRLQGNPHIIRLVAAEQDLQQRQINVIMEHGEIDLSERLRNLKGAMDENLLRVIWTQMLQAVDAIHSERIIHGDLKPANFLFVNGALKLIDFGIAKAISNDTTNIERDSQVGTINFMSPEAIQGNTMPDGQRDPEGKMKVGRASDIWSLGCILYQIVYSKPPFADVHSIIEKFRCIIDPSVPIPFPSLKNKDLENVIRSCLQRDHRRRPTITGDRGLLNHPFLRSGGVNSGVSSTVAVTTSNAPQVLTQLSDLLRSQGVANSRVNVFLSIGQEGLRNTNETPRSKRYLYNTQERRTEM